MKFSKKALSIPASMTLEITAKVNQLKSEGKQIIGFTAGEPDFNTPSYIVDAAKEALDKGLTKYTAVAGTLDLRNAICQKLKKDNGLVYKPNQIVVSTGAKSSLFHAIYALVDEGDEVIIPSPAWFTYEEQVKICGAKPVILLAKAENNYKITPEELEGAITEKTALIILNSPSNPTGAVYSESELKQFAEIIERHNLPVISDEIYEKLVYGNVKHVSIATMSDYMKENTVIINGVSKSYSMTGWRIGYLACSEKLANVITKVQGHTTSNACTFAQYASVVALSSGENLIENMRKTFKSRRDYMMKRCDELGLKYVTPEGAFYLFVDISSVIGKTCNGKKIEGSMSFANLLTDFGVSVIPGLPFHCDTSVRLSYAVSMQDIEEGFNRIGKFLSSLN